MKLIDFGSPSAMSVNLQRIIVGGGMFGGKDVSIVVLPRWRQVGERERVRVVQAVELLG